MHGCCLISPLISQPSHYSTRPASASSHLPVMACWQFCIMSHVESYVTNSQFESRIGSCSQHSKRIIASSPAFSMSLLRCWSRPSQLVAGLSSPPPAVAARPPSAPATQHNPVISTAWSLTMHRHWARHPTCALAATHVSAETVRNCGHPGSSAGQPQLCMSPRLGMIPIQLQPGCALLKGN